MTPLGIAHLSSISNSDNNSDGKSEMKPPETGSNSPTTVSAFAVVAKRSKRGRTVVLKDGKGGEMRESKGSESEHEIHIWTERERRKKMRNMFSGLHALLPQLPPKADKSTIVDEAVNYIKTLQTTLQMLQKKKLEMLRAGASMGGYNPCQMLMASTQVRFLEHRETYMANQGAASKDSAMEDHLDPSLGALAQQLPPSCFQSWSSPNVILSVNGLDAHISVCATKKPGLLVAILYILEKYMLDVITLQISTQICRSMYMIHAHAKGSTPDQQFPEAMVVEEVFKLAVGEIIMWLSS